MRLNIIKSSFISYLEIGELCDFSFIFHPLYFKQKPECCHLLAGPYDEHFYENVPKIPKTILLDHSCWLENQQAIKDEDRGYVLEKTPSILQWIDELKDEYKIYTLLYGGNQALYHKKLIPDYVIQIEMCDFASYLKQTETMETFVITHKGSYNLSFVDMLVRGIRIITYDNFIPKFNIERFNIPLYSDKESFLAEIRKPVNTEFWNNQVQKCSPLSVIAQAFNDYFTGRL